jgi:hypothetical protein
LSHTDITIHIFCHTGITTHVFSSKRNLLDGTGDGKDASLKKLQSKKSSKRLSQTFPEPTVPEPAADTAAVEGGGDESHPMDHALSGAWVG